MPSVEPPPAIIVAAMPDELARAAGATQEQTAPHAEPGGKPRKPHAQPGGKPRNMRAQVVAGLVIAGYRELFGNEAPRSAGGKGLPALIDATFKIMGIKAHPKPAILAARKAIERAAEERTKLARSS
jgi:hypothetical protein